MSAQRQKAKIGVLGASGYTGAELVRLLLAHPRVEIALLTADRRAGQEMARRVSAVLALSSCRSSCRSTARLAGAGLDLVFCALPHATTQKVIKELLARAPQDQGGRSLGRFPARRPGRLCALVRPRAPGAGAAERGGLRPDRGLSTRDQEGAARRQSRLLHDLRRSLPLIPLLQGQGDRARRDRRSTPSPA